MQKLSRIATFAGLVAAYAAAWMAGTRLLLPAALRDRPMAPDEQASAAIGLLLIAVIDVAVVWGIARASRLRGCSCCSRRSSTA